MPEGHTPVISPKSQSSSVPPRRPKTPMDPSVRAAWITFAGAIMAAIISIAGKKANVASERPVTLLNNFQAGLTLINPAKPASDSFHPSAETTVPQVQQPPIPTNVPSLPAAPASVTIANGTCSGLDKKTWVIQIAPVTLIKGKDVENHDLSGYNVNLRLSNVSDRSLALQHAQAELTDDQGNQLPLSSTSLPLINHTNPLEVSAGADLPVNLKFLGPGETGKTISFSVNLHIYGQEAPHIDKFETLACTNMPL